jgi:hypothetical protein
MHQEDQQYYSIRQRPLWYFVYTGTNMMPTGNEAIPALHLCTMSTDNDANTALRLCAGCQHVRCNCCQGASCMMIHKLDIFKWPDSMFMKWSAFINKTPALKWNTLKWNPKVADPA